MKKEKLKQIVKRSEEIFNNTYYKVLYHDGLNGAVIPSLIEICLLDAFEEIYGSRVMHGDETTGHDIEHRYFKNIAMEVKATSNVKELKFAQNRCPGDNKFPNKDKKVPHIFIAFKKELNNNGKYKLVYKKVLFGSVSYNDWLSGINPESTRRSLFMTKKILKENCEELI